MSIRSLYLSGDDEEELFRLTDPNEHPDDRDESMARDEEESLASSAYDDLQEEFDETAESTRLADDSQKLSDDQLADIVRLIEDIQNRREGEQGGLQ